MRIFLRFLVILALFSASSSYAKSLYWVGGSGNFNDPAHWSSTSGGVGGVKSPDFGDDVVFDENSGHGKFIVQIIGGVRSHNLSVKPTLTNLILSGTSNESINLSGSLDIAGGVDNQFDGTIHFTSSSSSNINFGFLLPKGDVYFNGSGEWTMRSNLVTQKNASVHLDNGKLKLSGLGIICGDLRSGNNPFILELTNAYIHPTGTLALNSNVSFSVLQSEIEYDTSNPFNTPGNAPSSLRTIDASPLSLTPSNIDSCSCNGVCDGGATIAWTGTGAGGPFSIVWNSVTPSTFSGVAASPFVCTGLCSNVYIVQVKDKNGNTIPGASNTVTIPQPAPIVVNFDFFSQPKCNGSCDGELSFFIIGGNHTYNVTCTPGPPTFYLIENAEDTLKNLCVGTEVVSVIDRKGCTAKDSFVITQPTLVVPNAGHTNQLCAGVCNNMVWVAPSGGTPYSTTLSNGIHYTTVWDGNPALKNDTLYNLCPGTHTCVVTDSNNCSKTVTVTINSISAISFTKNPASGTLNINCNNTCNGSVSVTGVTGGAGGYTYSWVPSGGTVTSTSTTSTYSGLCGSVSGITYTCTITDANSCTVTAVFTVKSPPALSNTVTITNPKCTSGQGSSTGSATVTASGGTSPFVFAWTPTVTLSGASPTSIGSGMNPGTYSVLITDNKGCLDTANITITPPTAITATITSQTNPTCPNLNNGQLCVTAGGGTGAYSYTWSPTGGNASCTPSTLTVTPGGSSVYTVTIKDVNSCSVTVTGTLTSPPQASITKNITNASCGSSPCTASATLTPSGGTGPFTYAWSCSGSVTNTISNQCAGTTCNYTVTDQGTNCKYTGSVTFAPAPPTLTVNLSATALACAGDCNSTITTTVNGGTAGYTYSWTGTGANPVNPTSSNQVNMCVGSYTCQVTDNLGCVKSATISITSPPALTVTLNATQPTCNSSCDGSIASSISGGTAPYTGINWSPSVSPPNAPNAPNPTGLCGSVAPGTVYTLTVTDNKGCQSTATATLIAPPSLVVTVAVDSITCNGLCNGTATASVAGGTPNYQYNWDGAGYSASSSTSGLCPGQHTLTVKDANGCVATTQLFNVFQPNVLATTVTNIVNTCGPCTGSASANPSGGTSPYTYTWTPTGGNGSTANGLCIGNYTLTVGDANGCPPVSTTFTISTIVSISITASSQSVSCNNGCDGIANAIASAGVAPYNMVWTASPGGATVATCNNVSNCSATNLCPGTYVITATDVNGCTNRDSVTIGNPPPITVSGNSTNVNCFGDCTGSATVTPGGGTSPYNVNWNTGSSGTTINNLCPGNYTATVTDSKGCPITQTFTITSNPQFTVTPTLTAPVACGGLTGNIQVTASGGVSAYTFSWNPTGGGSVTSVSPTSTLTGIPAGVYSVTVTDGKGCDTTLQIGLSDPGSPTVTVTSTSVTCNTGSNGSATVTAVGSPPVTITWTGGAPSGPSPITVGSLSAGSYSVQAVDGNGCQTFTTVVIAQPNKILDNASVTPATCSAGASISLNPTGGSGAGYTYSWSPIGGSGSTASNLPTGTYTCVVTDGNLCQQSFTYNVTAPSSPTLTVMSNNTLCSYSNNGSASANVSGGIPAYTYTWTGGSGVVASGLNVSNVSNLAAGVYTVAITDGGNCTSQQTFTISSATAISSNFVKVDNLCHAGCTGTATVSPTGGTGSYTYSWSPGGLSTPIVNNLCPNNYTVIVTDGNNCKDTTSFVINDPPSLNASISSANPVCSNVCSGSATVTVSGGTGSTYTVSWSPNICANCPVASNLCGGQYTVTAIDSNGCTNSQILTITTPPAILANTTTVSPVCFGDNNGSITSNTLNGTSPFVYSWSPPGGTVISTSTTSTYTNLPAGNYVLIITDANGCTDTSAQIVSDPPQLQMSASATSASCGQSNGSIAISSVNGNGAVTVQWINPSTCGSSLSCGSLPFGVYSVQLTDVNGCKDTFYVAVTNPNGPVIDSILTNSNCNSVCNGSITDTIISGANITTPYSFTWTPSSPGTITSTNTSSTFSGLCPGVYIATVADSLGCGTATTFTVTQPPAIQDQGNFTNATCVGVNDGTISSSAIGGTPGTTGYTYTLDGTTTNTTGNFTGVSVGVHTVCISDSVLCQKCFTYTISPNQTLLSQVVTTNVNCNGNCNGTATLQNVNGGTAPYTISWNDPNSQTGIVAMNLCAGSYIAVITDQNGCKAQQPATITEPAPLTVSAVSTDPACGQCNGTISVTPSGGTPAILNGYNYSWSNGANASSLSNVCAGVYQVNVTDSLGCTQSFQLPISNVGAPGVTVTATSPACSNQCTGSATVTANGGATPYTYTWPVGGQVGPTINNQCPGLYFVQVKDSAGCIATDSVQITQGTVLNIASAMSNPPCGVCSGTITTNVSGGSGNYSYNWLPLAVSTSSVTNVCAGNYTLIVTDNTAGCQDTTIIGLNNNSNGPTLAFNTTDVLCNNACNGTATVTASNGTPGYTYLWSNNAATPSITGLCPGVYAVVVTDQNNCIQTGQITITQPNALIASLSIVTQPKCNGDCNGSIIPVISGGTPGYSYSWSPSSISGTSASNLCAGNYSLSVVDTNGCVVNVYDTLVNPPLLALTGTVVPASCSNASDGAINTTTSGGVPGLSSPGYNWQWSGGSVSTNDSLSGIPVGNYTVVVTDSKNCTDTVSFTVVSTVTITANAGPDTNACSINTLTLNGVVSPGSTVQWIQLPNPPLTVIGNTPTVTVSPALGNNQYVLIAQNGSCTISDTVLVVSDTLPVPDAGNATSIFTGYSATLGGAPTNPSGGTIHWSPGAGMSDSTAANPVVTPSVTTTYTVYETNANGCVGWDTVTVTILPTFVIPNGFSPNGDGVNDVWQIDLIYLFPDCEVEVFNRWGEPLFYSKGYNTPWNGTYKGKPVPVGTYYYLIRLHDKEKKFPDHYTGPLTILR